MSPKLLAAGGAFALLLAGAAHAQDARAPSVALNLGVQSEYVFRGVSQTDEEPSVFGGADLAWGRAYLGTWASNVDYLDGTDAELDIYGGVKPTLGAATLDVGFVWYLYPGEPAAADYRNIEAKVGATVPAGAGTLTGNVYYSPDGFGAAVNDSVYYELIGAYPLNDKASLSAGLAHQYYDGPGDYTTWNLGGTWSVLPGLAADLRYHDTAEHALGPWYGARAVISLKASF